ncbi:MAG: MerR family transcriptional regulator, partial [Dehalococcoidia bacterium]
PGPPPAARGRNARTGKAEGRNLPLYPRPAEFFSGLNYYLDVEVNSRYHLHIMTSKRTPAVAGPEEAYLQIGEVAERTGVTQRTLRFYEEKGLLKPPTRMEGGFRLYSEADVQRVERIKRLQTLLGFSLAEIKEMVEAEEVKMQLRAKYRPEAALTEKKAQVERAIEVTERQQALLCQKVDALLEMKSHLEERLATYHGWLQQIEQDLKTETGEPAC